MNVSHVVQIVEGERDLGQVEAGRRLLQDAVEAVQQHHEVAARVEVHHEVQLLRVLARREEKTEWRGVRRVHGHGNNTGEIGRTGNDETLHTWIGNSDTKPDIANSLL